VNIGIFLKIEDCEGGSSFIRVNTILHQSFVFSENLYHTSLYGPIANGASVDPIPQVYSFAIGISIGITDCRKLRSMILG
jgi:hypothetical protein